ncbi:hypothetical protein, partial [[Roseibacterium] beibuensis]|uniref:hypothetical protein n=1 Tax=[Roseibacterium] beibuensis TaxID=1193142 RepID=UPI00217EB239
MKKRPQGFPPGRSPTSSSVPKEVPWTVRRVKSFCVFKWLTHAPHGNDLLTRPLLHLGKKTRKAATGRRARAG